MTSSDDEPASSHSSTDDHAPFLADAASGSISWQVIAERAVSVAVHALRVHPVQRCDRCTRLEGGLQRLKRRHDKLANDRRVAVSQAQKWKTKCIELQAKYIELQAVNHSLTNDHLKLGDVMSTANDDGRLAGPNPPKHAYTFCASELLLEWWHLRKKEFADVWSMACHRRHQVHEEFSCSRPSLLAS